MAKSSITEVSANNTFQVWLDKTNELVDLVKTDIVTTSLATAGGDVTVGNATLQGNFTANNIIASTLLRVDDISPKVGSTEVEFSAPVFITTNQTVLSRLSSTSGPRVSLFNTTDTDWQIGFENNTTKNFIITNGAANLKLTSSGNIEITGILSGTASIATTVALVATNTTNATHFPVFVDAATGNENVRTDTGFTYNPSTGILTSTAFAGNLTGNVTGNVTGNTSGTAGSVAAANITGTTLASNVVTSSLTTVGTLTNLTVTNTITGSINGNAGTVTNGVYTSRTISPGTGLLGGGTLAADRTLSVDFASLSDATTLTSATKVMNPARTLDSINAAGVKAFIVFNGATGAVIKSRNLTLTRVAEGNYSFTCDASIRDGSSNWGVVITNVDDGDLSQNPNAIPGGLEIDDPAGSPLPVNHINNFQADLWNAFATSFTTTGFTVRAKRTYSQWYSFLVGNDNGGGNAFGIEAVDPTRIALVVF
jgi:hypothetical protein